MYSNSGKKIQTNKNSGGWQSRTEEKCHANIMKYSLRMTRTSSHYEVSLVEEYRGIFEEENKKDEVLKQGVKDEN